MIAISAACFATQLVIEKTDGTIINIDTEQIKQISFGEEEQETPVDTQSKELLAHWALNGDTYDYSGAGRNAQNFGAVTGEGINGKRGWAMDFKGSAGSSDKGAHVMLPFIDLESYPSFSISLWVKEQKMETSDGEAYIWFGDHFEGGLGIAHFYGNVEFFANRSSINVPFQADYLNKWMHYALVQKDGRLTAYVNGRAVGSADHTPKIGTQNAALARHWWGKTSSSTRFTGSIDEVRIYGKALSQEELAALYAEKGK